MKLYHLAAAALASASLLSSPANAAVYDLAFIMDESGSVASSDYSAAMTSLADALDGALANNPSDTYNVRVISFSDSASVVASASIGPMTSAATIQTALTNDIRTEGTSGYSGGLTCYSCAFGAVGNSNGDAGIINMMTDGAPTTGQTDPTALAGIRDNLRTVNGWDSMSFEAVGAGANTGLLSDLAFDTAGTGPQPVFSDPNMITDPLNASFVLEVSAFGTAYDAAISAKVQRIVTPQIPLPAGLPLILSALGALGALRLRKRTAA